MILLTTNLFKKEFSSTGSQNQYEVGMAINCLANIATKELARDCISDLVTLMNHSKPYIRKKAILAMYKLYIKFPQGLRLTFDKLKERLDDAESSVISTAVNVVCELANKNPKNYLAMAPKFFKLLTTSSNNWMLIKVVKLLGSLVSEEPRLARKLLEPLVTIIKNTGAKSLQYECIFTITEALPFSRREDGSEARNAPEVIATCSEYLRGFIEDADQNLKYLGLVGLCNLMKSSPRSVVDHRDLILGCLNDDDVTIRTKALELLAGIASKKSLVDLVHHLLDHVRRSEGSYRDELIAKILWMCRRDKYQLVTDFAWYVSVLLDLAVMQGARHGREVADQLMEIALRVESVRPFAVDQLLSMLLNEALTVGQARATVVEVLRAAAWVTAEYAEVLAHIAADRAPDAADDADDSSVDSDASRASGYWIEGATGEERRSLWRGQPLHFLVLKTLLGARSATLPPSVQIVYLQAAMKLFVRATLDCGAAEVADVVGLLRTGLPRFAQHVDLEVQERATTLRHLLAALHVLPLDWEAQFAAQSQAPPAAPPADASALLDLMSMMAPAYDASSLRALDEAGARAALSQRDVLAALVKETFYAVHAKAQRKVPLPADLRLDAPFNAAALTKLVKTPLPEELSLATLVFVREREPLPNFPSSSSSSASAPPQPPSQASQSTAQGFGAYGGGGGGDARLGHALDDIFAPSPAAPPAASRGADDVFMLGGGAKKLSAELAPLSRVLGDFDEIPSQRSGRRAKKSDRRGDKATRRSKKSADVAQVEMLPAGAAQSESDDERRGRRGRAAVDDDAEPGLAAIDITRPLDADEVLPVQTHRVVPSAALRDADVGAADAGDKKKRRDKDKRRGRDKDRRVDDAARPAAEDDLLGLDWPAAAPVAAPAAPAAAAPPAAELLQLDAPAASSSSSAKRERRSRASDVDAASWRTLHRADTWELRYGVAATGAAVDVLFEVASFGGGGVAAAELELQPHPLVARVSQRRVALLSGALPGGERQRAAAPLTLTLASPTALWAAGSVQLTATLHVTSEGLLGTEATHLSAPLRVTAAALLQPYALDAAAFADKVAKASSKWAKRAATLPVTSGARAKSLFERIGATLRAHCVEGESSKAATFAAKAPDGTRIYVLCKFSGGSSSKGGGLATVSVDVKCLGGSEAESQAAAAVVLAALEQETW